MNYETCKMIGFSCILMGFFSGCLFSPFLFFTFYCLYVGLFSFFFVIHTCMIITVIYDDQKGEHFYPVVR